MDSSYAIISDLNKPNVFYRIICWFLIYAQLLQVPVIYASQQIIPDGLTQTQLDIQGNTTSITTESIYDSNAINSFSKFDVYQSNIVNLHVPESASNLINLVHDSQSNINGILNTYQRGVIGGNVYFLNPHGVFVSEHGVINTGNMHLMTPTEEYMEVFFNGSGSPSTGHINQLMHGEVPLSSTGLITIEGRINARQGLEADASLITVDGQIRAGHSSGLPLPSVGDIINIEGAQQAAHAVVNADGSIDLFAAADVVVNGDVLAEGVSGQDGGDISIRAAEDITVAEGALVSAKGRGEDSDAGTIYIYADNTANFEVEAEIDVSGGDISGDGGFAEFSATRTVNLQGGQFNAHAVDGEAGEVFIDPENLTITSNQLMNGGNYSLLATESITISDNITISSRAIGSATDQDTAASIADSGDVTLTAPSITLGSGSQLLAHATDSHDAGDITLAATSTETSSITLNNTTIKGANVSIQATASTVGVQAADNPVSTATATIDVNSGTRIIASGNVTIAATATQDTPNFNNGLFDARDAIATTTVNGATITATGNVDVSSESSITTDLGAWVSGLDSNGQLDGIGSPLSFLVATTDSEANTSIQGASSISAGGTVDVTSEANTTSTVAAQATFALATATVAISDVKNESITEVKGTSNIISGGTTTVGAQGTALIDAVADASTIGSSGGSVAFAISHLDSDTKATVAEGAHIASSGNINIHADTINQAKNSSRAGVRDAKTFAKDELGTTLDNAGVDAQVIAELKNGFGQVLDKVFEFLSSGGEEDDSSFQAAGAISVNIVDNDTEASVTGNTSKIVSASGLLDVQTQGITHAVNLASGIAKNGAIGGGIGLAVQIADNTNRAFVEAADGNTLTLSTNGLSVEALTQSYDDTITAEDNNDFSSSGYSGAGASDISLSGAIGVNVVEENEVEALVGENTVVNLSGGNLTVAATNTTQTNALADGRPDPKSSNALDAVFGLYDATTPREETTTPPSDGEEEEDDFSLGISASIALNITQTETYATVHSDAQVNGSGAISVTATSDASHDVGAEANAASGVSIVPLVTLIVADDTTKALIDTSSVGIVASGDITVAANQAVDATAFSDGGDPGNATEADLAVGMAVNINIVRSVAQARIDRNITTSGDLAVTAASIREVSSGAASVINGGTSDPPEDDDGTGSDTEQGIEQGADVVNTITSLVNLGNAMSTSGNTTDSEDVTDQATVDSGGEDSASISVAAALAVNVTDVETTAVIDENRVINAGSVDVTVTDNTDSKAVATGDTGGADVNLGAGVALNIVDVDNSAIIENGADINAAGDIEVSISASEAEEEDDEGNSETNSSSTFQAGAIAGAGQGNFSLAGAVGINVVNVDAIAEIQGNADVSTTNGGDLTVSVVTDTVYDTSGEGVSGATSPTIDDVKDEFTSLNKLQARIDGVTQSINDVRENSESSGSGGSSGGGSGGEEDSSDSSIGIGAAFAINIGHEVTRAQIADNADATVAGNLTVEAETSTYTATAASAGAGPDNGIIDPEETESVAYSLDAAVALNILDQDIEAKVGTDTETLTVTGNTTIEATSDSFNETTADGEAAGESVAAGASVAVSVVTSDTTAYLGRNLNTGGTFEIAVTSDAQDIVDAQATARGLILENYANKFKQGLGEAGNNQLLSGNFNDSNGDSPAAKPHSVSALSEHGASTQSVDQEGNSDSEQSDSISIAAAVGVNAIDYDSSATTADGLTLSIGGNLDVTADTNTNYNTRGTGVAVLSDNAIAVGVGVTNTLNDTTARIGANTTITTADAIAVDALSTQNQHADFANKLAAEGIAGAGAKKIGVAGALALINNLNNTDAIIGSNTTIATADSLTIEATDLSRLRAKAWGASVAVNDDGDSKAAVGAAFAVINTINDVEAELEEDSTVTVTGNVRINAESLRQSEDDFNFSGDFSILNPTAFLQTSNYYTEAVGAAGATGDNALAGSFGVTVSNNDIHATIGDDVTITAGGALDMDAKNRTNARSLTGGVAAAQKLAIGGTVSGIVLRDMVSATIGDDTAVTTNGDIGINAEVEQDIGNVALAGALATSENALAGAAGINVFDNEAKAEVGSGSSAKSTAGNVEIKAENDTSVINYTGQGTFGSKTGAGGVIALNLFLNETLAIVESNSVINAAGQLDIIADSSEDILNGATGATGGGDNAVAGTLGLNTIKTVTKAETKSNSRLNDNNDSTGANQGITVKAISDTDMAGLVGTAAIGGNNGIGASLDTNVIWKDTLARIDGTANADRNILVIADVEQDLSAAAAGFAGGQSTSVAGAGSIGIFKSTTEALIAANSTVYTDGNLKVHAEDETDIIQLTGNASISGDTAIGGAIGASVFVGRTTAAIQNGATITAFGQGGTIDVVTGEVTDTSILAGGLSDDEAGDLRASLESELSGQSITAIKESISGETKNTESVRGVSVTAFSDQDLINIAAAGSGGGGDTVAGNVATSVVSAITEAYIGSATINSNNTGANSDQDVIVRAIGDTNVTDFSGALSAGGGNAIGGAGDVVTVVKTTRAYIAENATVNALDDVAVEADARERLVSIAAGFSGGGDNAVSGSLGVGVMKNTTTAFIDGTVTTGDDLTVEATDTSESVQVAGSIAIGGGNVGVGASLGVAVFNNTTKAHLGANAETSAGGLTKVRADSDEIFYGVTIAGSGSGAVGVAGALAIRVHDSTTQAYILNDVNQNAALDQSGQSVLVEATNDIRELGATGGITGGGNVGVGLAADVVVVKNQANAYIGNNARVSAYDDVDVIADTAKRAESYVVAFGGGGTVGVAGSVSVMSIGSIVDSDSRDQLSGSDDNGNSGSSWAAADSRTGSSQVGGQLGNSSEAGEIKGILDSYNDDAAVSSSFSDSTVLTDRTQAFIGAGARVVAGRDVRVTAEETTITRVGLGTVSVGGNVAVGGSVGIVLVDNSAEAYIGDGASVYAGRNLEVEADTEENMRAVGIAGGGAVYVAVNGTIITQSILSDTLAYIDDNATINSSQEDPDDETYQKSVSVNAESDTTTFSLAGDGGGAIVGIGASGNVTTIGKLTRAYVDENATVRADNNILIDAHSEENLLAVAVSAQGGAAGIGGVAVPVIVNNTTEAFINDGATVFSDGNLRIQAVGDTEIDNIPLAGQVGGATVGGALGLNTVTNTTRAYIDTGATVTALGNAAGVAVLNGDISTSDTEITAKTTTNSEGTESEDTNYMATTVTRATTVQKGLSVVAKVTQHVTTTPVGFSASASSAHSATAGVTAVATTTEARIADTVTVNNQNTGAGSEQKVAVKAFDHTEMEGVAVTGSLSAGGANTLSVDVSVVDKTVLAEVGGTVKSRADVIIEAESTEVLDIAIMDAGISNQVGTGGSVGISTITNDVTARLRANSDVETYGNLTVAANSDSEIDKVTGRVGAGGTAAIGAGIGVDVIANTVRAYIDTNADTDASGRTRIAASSREDFDSLTIAGSLGGALALAGSFGVKVDATTTQAYIADDADVNQTAAYDNATQDVEIDAHNEVIVVGNSGAGALSLLGSVGIGADITIVRNTTIAYTGSNVEIDAGRDVTIEATSSRDIETTAIAGAGGLGVGAAGSLNLVFVGSKFDNDSQGQLTNDNGSVVAAIDSEASRDYAADHNSGDKGSHTQSTHRTNNQDTTAISANTTNLESYLNETNAASLDKTRAYVGTGSTIVAGDDITINARDDSVLDLTAGGAALGAGALGGWFAVGVSYTTVEAFSGAGVTLNASDDVQISARVDKKDDETSTVEAVGGAAGLLGYAGSFAVLKAQSNALAYTGINNTLTGDDLTISADRIFDLDVEVTGGALGLFAAGAAISDIDITGLTEARIGSGTVASTNNDGDLDEVQVRANSSVTARNRARAGAAGLYSGTSGALADTTDTSTTRAKVDNNATVRGDDITLIATATPLIESETFGVSVSGGISIGLNEANAVVSSTIVAETGTDVTLDAEDDLTIEARLNAAGNGRTVDTNVTGSAGGLAVGAGATEALSNANASISALTGSGNTITTGGGFSLLTDDRATAYSDVTGVNVGLLAAGSNTAESRINTSSLAILGADSSVTVGEQLRIAATGTNTIKSMAEAGAGGLGAVIASRSLANMNSQTRARIADSTSLTSNTITAGDVDLEAHRTVIFDSKTDSFRASVVGGSGARASNTITSNVSTDVGNYADLEADDLDLLAQNTATKNIFTGDNVRSGSGGALDVAAGVATTTLNQNTDATLGGNVDIDVGGAGETPNTLSANTVNTATLDERAKLESGGAIAVARATSNLIYNSTGDVDVGAGADIDATGNIDFGSRTVADLDTFTKAKTFGLAGAAEGDSDITVNVTQNTRVGTNANLRSEGNIALRAGTDGTNGNNINANAQTRLWNQTALPVSTQPDATSAVTQNNIVTIGTGSEVASVLDTTLQSDNGTVVTVGYGEAQDLYQQVAQDILNGLGGIFGAEPITLLTTSGSTSNDSNAGVMLQGTVRASIENQESITFGTDFHGYDASGSDLLHRDVVQNSEGVWEVRDGSTVLRTIDASSQTDGLSWSFHDHVDLQQVISNEISRLTALQNAYTGAPEVQAAIQAEISRLTLEQTTIPDGTQVQVVELANTTVKTGDVKLFGDYVVGTGNIQARGDAHINVINNSPTYLRVNNLEIPDREGGYVFMNNIRVQENTDINGHSIGSTGAAAFTITDRGDTPAPSISIQNNFDPDSSIWNTGNLPDLLAPEIQVRGTIDNLDGTVSLFNEAGSIVSSGNINADTVNITAGEDFVQNYVTGIYNVGGDPTSLFNDIATGYETAAWDARNDYRHIPGLGISNRDSSPYHVNTAIILPSDPSSTIAANNVFISAEILNLNGRIRSGINDYSATIADADVNSSAVTNARNSYNTAVANGQDASSLQFYQLTGEGADLSEIDTFLNFATDEIQVGTTAVMGGLVQLTGRIISTGNGRIEAMDGYGRINLNNQTNKTLVLGRLDTGGNIEGRIIINDTGRTGVNGLSHQTVYTRVGNSLKVVDNTTVDSEGNASNTVVMTTGRASTYTPESNQRFHWVTGSTETIRKSVLNRYEDDIAFGFVWTSDYLGEQISSTTISSGTTQLINGGYVGTSSDTSDYSFQYTRYLDSTDQISINTVETCVSTICAGDLGRRARFDTTRIIDENYNNVYEHSVNASKVVDIEFIGYDDGQLNITSLGNVVIDNNISNQSGNTTISAGGDITQRLDTASIQAQTLTLNAISGTVGSASDVIQLSQEYGNQLNIAANNDVYINALNGNLTLGNINSSTGLLNIAADDNIFHNGSSGISAEQIHLTSHSAGIGTSASKVQLNQIGTTDASLTVEAAGDIYLEEVSGDLYVNRIETRGGDVTLVVQDDLYDANTEEVTDTLTQSELLALYEDVRLIGDSAADSASDAVTNYRNQKNQAYENYWRARGIDQAYDATTTITLTATQRTDLKTRNSWVDADVDAYETTLTQQYHADHLEFGSGAYNADFNYAVNTEETTNLQAGSVWTEDQLANSIAAGIVRTITDTQSTIENANITGKNITITAGGSVGKDLANIVVDKPEDSVATLTDSVRVALAAAERDDLVITENRLTIKQKDDFDIATSGNVNITASEFIYLGSEQDINIDNTSTNGDGEVRIKSEGGIYDVGTGDQALHTGDLILEAATGAIGDENNAVRVNLGPANDKKLTARAAQDIRIQAVNSHLGIDTIYTPEDVYLTTTGNFSIYDYYNDTILDIRARDLTLVAGGDIGKTNLDDSFRPVIAGNDAALDVILTSGVLRASVTGSDSTVSIHSLEKDLNVEEVTAGAGIRLTSEQDINTLGNITVTGTDGYQGITLTAEEDISLGDNTTLLTSGGTISASTGGQLALNDSNLVVNEGSGNVELNSSGAISTGEGNQISTQTGDIAVTGTEEVALSSLTSSAGNLIINAGNSARFDALQGEDISITTNVSQSTIGIGNVTVGNSLNLQGGASTIGSITSTNTDQLTVNISGTGGSETQSVTINALGTDNIRLNLRSSQVGLNNVDVNTLYLQTLLLSVAVNSPELADVVINGNNSDQLTLSVSNRGYETNTDGATVDPNGRTSAVTSLSSTVDEVVELLETVDTESTELMVSLEEELLQERSTNESVLDVNITVGGTAVEAELSEEATGSYGYVDVPFEVINAGQDLIEIESITIDSESNQVRILETEAEMVELPDIESRRESDGGSNSGTVLDESAIPDVPRRVGVDSAEEEE